MNNIELKPNISKYNTAVIVIDVQNDFMDKNSILQKKFPEFMDKKHDDIPSKAELLLNLQYFLKIMRNLKVPIIFVQSDYSILNKPLSVKFQIDQIYGKLCIPGKSGFQIHNKIKPLSEEFIVTKRTHSAFIDTDLDLTLKNKIGNIQNLIISGVETNVCVESSIRDASALGYFVYTSEELISGSEVDLHFASLKNFRNYFGWIKKMEDLISEIANT